MQLELLPRKGLPVRSTPLVKRLMIGAVVRYRGAQSAESGYTDTYREETASSGGLALVETEDGLVHVVVGDISSNKGASRADLQLHKYLFRSMQ